MEGLADDIDFKGSVSREEFEALCEDLKPKFSQPILDALAEAGLQVVSFFSAYPFVDWLVDDK